MKSVYVYKNSNGLELFEDGLVMMRDGKTHIELHMTKKQIEKLLDFLTKISKQ